MTLPSEKHAEYEAPAVDEALQNAFAPEEIQKDELTLLKEENAALKDRALRALADFENLRRRSEKDIADAHSYGVTKFARDLLNVADNLQRALQNANGDGVVESRLIGLIEGIELTEKELHSIFTRFNVQPIEALGAKFDPNKHQAMFEIEDTNVPHGTVQQVIQAGFAIGERTLRPALVGVSKGGVKG